LNLLSIALGIGAEDAILRFGRILTRLPISQIGDFFAHASRANKVKRLTPDRKLVYQDALDVLPPKAMDKVVDNPELLDVWTRMRQKTCPLGRSSLNKCEDLLVDVFGSKRPDIIKDFEKDALVGDFWDAVVHNHDYVKIWETIFKRDIDAIIRTNPDYLEVINRFPFNGGTSKLILLNNASKSDFKQIFSGKLVQVKSNDPNAKRLQEQYGGEAEVRFDTDPVKKEFDVITEDLIIEHKAFNTNRPRTLGGDTVEKIKIQFEACVATNRNFILHVDGPIDNDFLSKFEAIRSNYLDISYRFLHNDILILSDF